MSSVQLSRRIMNILRNDMPLILSIFQKNRTAFATLPKITRNEINLLPIQELLQEIPSWLCSLNFAQSKWSSSKGAFTITSISTLSGMI